ncbi:hypothetical patatin-like protein [Actinomycetospora sp. NBRC 106375]|uniref:patatin-like phospholipase family protein n=1 Tax=Actinomycetospora sp. NBRC 106375 TaxID=3032207 RepID=UPI0024A38446|nr:patatin-like phospholipase family protein [Actinomycetospora sp. NBRC 106375]GLZ48900.1 hypothetical patatin-like protein [Actinomycetospora sp. NBRC 106375]
MSTVLVLSGGGSLGAVQVGMLAGLAEAGVAFDVVIGTSVGAINAAWIAGDPGLAGVERLAGVWRGLRRADIFPSSPWWGLLAASGRRSGLVSQHRLRSLLDEHVRFERIEDATTPLHVVAVDAQSGQSTLLSTGSAVDAVLASAAIPGVFAPVAIGDRWFIDGGVVDNCSISHAVGLGADTVWVLPAGYPCAVPALPTTATGMALHGLTLLVHQRLAPDLERYRDQVDLRVVPSLCPLSVSPADFSRADELIDSARTSTRTWLARGCPPEVATAMLPHPHAGGSITRQPVADS